MRFLRQRVRGTLECSDLSPLRYNSITRFSPDSRSARSRRRSVETSYLPSRKTESVSSSSSASPTTPPLSLPILSSPTIPLMMPHASHSRYEMGWQSTPLVSDDSVTLHSYNGRGMHSFTPSAPSSTTSDTSYQSLDVNMNLTDVHSFPYTESNSGHYYKVSSPSNHPHGYSSSRPQSNIHPSYSPYPPNNTYGSNYNEVTNQYTPLSSLPSSTETLVGLSYDAPHSNPPLDNHRYKMQQPQPAGFSVRYLSGL